ncbi:MAG TPA: glycosyltransferase family 4 protein [candidate division Zixibacteria bacterium]|nr:glycosyltransferase family 4 protein [candidate division Zixibacteria bacterium]
MTRRLSVVHLNDLAFTGTTLVRRLRAMGVDATLIDPVHPGRDLRWPWRLRAVPRRYTALLAAALRARRRRPQLLHLHYARMGWMARVVGRPYVLHCHGTDIRGVSPDSRWGRLTAPWLRDAARVLYATPDLEAWVRPFRPDATFLPNPIEIPEPAPDEPHIDLLVAVRFDAVKGAEQVLEVMRRLRAIRPQTSMTVVERGARLDEALAAAGPDAWKVPFLPHDDMPALIARHRLALGQMAVGALGTYELEAMASGVPTAAAFRYAAAYPEPPPLVAGATPQEIAASLARLLDDEAARRQLGEASRAWVTRHHGAEAVTARVLELYREILAA